MKPGGRLWRYKRRIRCILRRKHDYYGVPHEHICYQCLWGGVYK